MLAGVVAASVALPVVAAARPAAVPAPAPAVPFDVAAATPAALAQRYAGNRDGIRAAARTAAAHGDRRRAGSLRAMAAPGRHFLSFDGRDGGRSAEVFGDLAHAGRIAVLVPGSDTGLDSYGRFRAGAEALRRELRTGAPAGGSGADAVVAWLGYATPSTVSPGALTPGRAEAAAPRLRDFVRSLRTARPGARISLLCHSYGSVVCGRAAAELPVADIVLYGSPGVGAGSAAELGTSATVWAGRGADDWVGDVPHVRIPLLVTTLGFGTDPVSGDFGACPFAAGPGGHSDYLDPGSAPLRSMARIVRGEAACAGPEPPEPEPYDRAPAARTGGPRA
ncbi:alpha/beta hydrolase [Streptomyces sp. 184]|uniref:alpha/beta hydrolase n=1 Tax=Streptomyces sp. 184 TaxID=1827526 RepID=UPI0038914CB1